MKHSYLLAIAVAAAAALPSAATAAVAPPDVPSTIAVTGDEKPFLAAHAEGVQIYACRSGAWALAGPRATLYGGNGQVVARHFVGPTWQATDGSRVVGSRVDGVSVPGAIQWLLLARASSSVGPDGDRLAGTTHIQRINTVGGLPPEAGRCVAEGAEVEAPCKADYVFWKATGSCMPAAPQRRARLQPVLRSEYLRTTVVLASVTRPQRSCRREGSDKTTKVAPSARSVAQRRSGDKSAVNSAVHQRI